jgi:hypothetical protein
MSGPKEELIIECNRQSENCSYTSASFTIWLRFLKVFRTFSMTSPIIFGALATWKVVSQTSPIWGAIFTLLATVIPPVYRAMKVDASIEEYTTATGEFTNLRDRFRQAALISSHKPFPEFDADAKPLLDRLEKARRRALTPPEWSFWLARRKHRDGHYKHDCEELKSS